MLERVREVLHLTAEGARRLPWKNGRGFTSELALWPPTATLARGDFAWRISKAAVDEPGPFSAFPGFERILVVTEGEGLVLDHGEPGTGARLRRLEPYRFSGDAATTAELQRGPIVDFNVLVRRGLAQADVQAVRLGRRRVRETLPRGQAFLHVVAGRAVTRLTGEEEPFRLRASESLWARGLEGGEELELTGEDDACALLLVRLEERAP